MIREAGFEPLAERWDFAPQMWSASIHHRLSDSRLSAHAHALSALTNPLVALPAIALGALEWLLRRTTMYESIGGAPLTVNLGVGAGDPASSVFTTTSPERNWASRTCRTCGRPARTRGDEERSAVS